MLENAPLWRAGLAGLALIAGLGVLTWIASVVRRDVSLVDRTWSVFIFGAGAVYWALLPATGVAGSASGSAAAVGSDTRGGWMLALGAVWALRLCAYITARNWGHGEDRRYQEIRARNQPNFAFKSLYLVFGLQALLAWTVSAPFFAAMAGTRPIGALDVAGLALAAFGIVFEAVGDWQMSRFKADPAHKGQVMDRGLWRYTRHPNYFGEVCTWWGFWLVALGGAGLGGAWSVVSPVLMTFLLLKVSGVTLLEKDMAARRPAYRDYIARTNAFFPGPPRAGKPT